MSEMKVINVVHLVPLFRYAIFIIIGIVTGEALSGIMNEEMWLLVMLLLTAIAAVCNKKYPLVSSIMILAAVVAMGGFRLCYNRSGEYVQEGVMKTQCAVAVTNEPVVHGKVIHFDGVMYDAVNEEMNGTRVRVSLLRDTITKKYEEIHIGEGIRGEMEVMPLQEWRRVNQHFSYVKWLRTRGFSCRAFVPIGKWEHTEVRAGDIGMMEMLKIKAQTFRQTILERMESSGMERDAFAVATAMALGNKAALTPEIREEYSMAGASHVLALSGVHLSIIYMMLTLMIKRRRIWNSVLVLLMVWAYVVFAGMPVSVLRAACMLTIWEVLRLVEHKQKALNVLGGTACIMVMVSPQCVWDVGFQMSFAAVLAIILLMDPFSRIMPEKWKYANKKKRKTMSRYEIVKYKVLRGGWFTMALSISAQLGTMPLSAYYFGRIAVYFLLTNLLVIPAVTVIVWLTMIMTVVVVVDVIAGVGNGIVTLGLGKVLGWIAGGVNWGLGWIAGLPGASVEGVWVTEVQVVAWYVIIVVGIAWVNRRAWK